MRILVIPQLGLKSIHTDSRYLGSMDLVECLIERGHFCYMWLPEYAQDQVSRLQGLMYVYKPYDYDFYTEVGMVDLKDLSDLFARSRGKYFVDAIVTDIGAQVPMYQLALSDFVHKADVPCVVIHPAVYEIRTDQQYASMFYALQALGSAYSVPVFIAPHQKSVALKNARKFLAPTEVKKIDKNALLVSLGVPCDKVDRIREGLVEKKFEKFTLFYGGRLNHVKRPELIFELYGKFVASGRNAQVKMTSNTAEVKFFTYTEGKEAYEKVKDVVDIVFSCSRDKYMEIALKSHVGICWSVAEGFPTGFWEQMYMGIPVLFCREPWVVAQLPEWYPWVFRSKTEAFGMLTYIYENYDKVVKDMERMQDFIREVHNAKVTYALLEKHLVALDKKINISYARFGGVQDMINRAVTLFEPGEVISVPRMLSVLAQLGDSFPLQNKVRMRNANMPKDYEVYRMMLFAGFKDTFKTPLPQLIVPERMGVS